ncbi:Fic family protein [Maridesulfovibrio ferrireducens]|uniref:Fic family protein n=1 Tax=Maridesulfovibrio ferrireducens TaxID=246191 RepID=A0A1G9JNU5_9BACT|nr:Fic family protein [Maridesulfovibrio ferrireducens]SDL39131.1 Fic family protein [Maridesulfovibrio ferrireducens]
MFKNGFNIPVIKHLTHKSGNFIFSCECDELVINPLMVEFNTLYESIKKLPVLPSLFAKLETDLIRSSIFGTAAIEGNPLSEEEVRDILNEEDENEVEDNNKNIEVEFRSRAQFEIRNLKVLYSLLGKHEVANPQSLLFEEFIKTTHSIVTTNIDYHHNSPGIYRNEVVEVGDKNHGGVYKPPKTLDDIKTLMGIFIEWINSPEMLEVDHSLKAALAHYHLAMIHPFQDGNGRTARFVEASLLKVGGASLVAPMMSNFYYRNIDEYFISFSKSRKAKDMTPFLQFYYRGLIESLEEVQDKVVGVLNVLLFKDYMSSARKNKHITSRQHDLVLQLIETKKEFSLRSLYADPVFKPLYVSVAESTSRRDIKKLVGLKVIKEIAPKQYGINWEWLKSL